MIESVAVSVTEPGPGVGPFLASEVDRDAQGGRGVLVPQAGELAELDDLGRDRVLGRMPTEVFVEGEEIVVRVGVGVGGGHAGEVDPAEPAAPFLPCLAPGGLDQNATHCLGRSSEEVTPAVPLGVLVGADQPQVSLADPN